MPLLVFFLLLRTAQQHVQQQRSKFKNTEISMVKMLNTNKIYFKFHSWRVADTSVVGGKNTHNGMGRLLLKIKTNKSTN